MYTPLFNSVLVEIDDKDAEWGSGNDESMLGKSYSKGTVIKIANILGTKEHPIEEEDWEAVSDRYNALKSQQIMWNEGVEAGTTFEEAGKLYGMIYWWDIRGFKD